jgi:DNA repair protein RadC
VYFTEQEGHDADVSFSLKQIVTDALASEAAGILLAHNHPSGDPWPSEDDCLATREIARILKVLDCALVDHLILTTDDYTSFRELGLL